MRPTWRFELGCVLTHPRLPHPRGPVPPGAQIKPEFLSGLSEQALHLYLKVNLPPGVSTHAYKRDAN